jgi:hypothetical protein
MPSNAFNTDFSERPRRLTLKWCVRIWIRIHQIFVTFLTDTDGGVRPVPLPVLQCSLPVSNLKILWCLQRVFRLSSYIPEDRSNMFHQNIGINQHHYTLSESRKLQSAYGGLFVISVTEFHTRIQSAVMFLVIDVAVYRWIRLSVECLHGSTHDRNSGCCNPMLKHLACKHNLQFKIIFN